MILRSLQYVANGRESIESLILKKAVLKKILKLHFFVSKSQTKQKCLESHVEAKMQNELVKNYTIHIIILTCSFTRF